MTPVAITMMIVAIVTIWGGFVASVWFLLRHPAESDPGEETTTGGVPGP